MAKFTGLTDDERSTLKSLLQELAVAGDMLKTAREAFDAFNVQMREKYELTARDQIVELTASELEAAESNKIEVANSALDSAMERASQAERDKYNVWVAAGRPLPKKRIPEEG